MHDRQVVAQTRHRPANAPSELAQTEPVAVLWLAQVRLPMKPIERQIEQRKALMQQWAFEIGSLIASKAGLSERQQLEIERQIIGLRYKIGSGQWALKDLEELAAEGRSSKRERPHMPNARRLSVVERQLIEQEERAKVIAALKPSRDMEVHVYVGRTTDENGKPQISLHITSRRKFEDDA